MKISELLKEKYILTSFKSDIKEEIINEMIDLFKDDERVTNLEEIRKCVLDREKIMSTGVGKGFAIPHGKSNSVNDIIAAFGKSAQPIEYNALDGKPVQLIFLMVGQEKLVGSHIKVLSRISRIMNNDDFRAKLLEAKSKEEILNAFENEEKTFNDI
jgi:fructose-specific phosphotransferase system IIA component